MEYAFGAISGFSLWEAGVYYSEGIIDQQAMAKNRLTIDELNLCLRQAGILDPQQVQYADAGDQRSADDLPLPKVWPLTPETAGKKAPRQEFPVNLICNGRIMEENLQAIGKEPAWLDEALAREKVTLEEVFWMTGTAGGTVQIVRREAGE